MSSWSETASAADSCGSTSTPGWRFPDSIWGNSDDDDHEPVVLEGIGHPPMGKTFR